MGRRAVGAAPGAAGEGSTPNAEPKRGGGNAGSFNQNRANLDAGRATRFVRKHPDPCAGDRFGELTVLGIERVVRGAMATNVARVQCDCGAPAHTVYLYNLRKGKSTRCNACAKKQAGYWRKTYHGYADIVADDAHRRRLLDRISACINRCHNPKDGGYENYGGRGIEVHAAWREDRRGFLAHIAALEGWDNPKLDLDRIEVNAGYQPGNLRFITRRENCNNKRTVREMQQRIFELEARIRHLEQRAE